MKYKLIKKLNQKSRLKEYESLLKYAINNGYSLVGLANWYNLRSSNKKFFILRHDVDHDPHGAYEMFKIEKSLGANSTFYFRWNTMNYKIMHEMNKAGFEVSLHFETIASYAKKKRIYNVNKFGDDDFIKMTILLKNEILLFKEKYWEIKTICSHGDRRNRILKTPNHRLIKYLDLKPLNILFETYEDHILNNFDYYISDSSLNENYRWKGANPHEAINEGPKNICLLTHPIHWNHNFIKNLRVSFKQFKEDFF